MSPFNVSIVNVKVYVNRDFIRILKEINVIVESSFCKDFISIMNRKGEVGNVTEVFVKCLKDIKEKIYHLQDEVLKYLREKKTESNISNFTKCFEKCSKIVKRYSRIFKIVDSLYNTAISSLTTHGDSVIERDKIPDIVKRIARHLEIDESLTSIHVIRFGLAKSMLEDVIKCLINECGISEVKQHFDKLVENILRRGDKSNEYVKFVLDKMSVWCKEYNLC